MKTDDILRTLRSLSVTQNFVYHAMKLFEYTDGVTERPRFGRSREVTTPKAMTVVQTRIHQNPLSKHKKMPLAL